MDNLDEKVIRCRDVLSLHPPGHSDRSSSLCDLSYALWSRFQQTGRTDDLHESIACDRDALQLRPEGHPDYSMSLNSLTVSLRVRFEQSGRMEDLEELISLYRTALDLLPTGHPRRSRSSMSLATAVWTRFSQSGRMEDLEESISLYRTALDLLPTGHSRRSRSSINLANALKTRFSQSGRMEDLEESISLYHTALDLLPIGHPHRSMSSMNLATAVWTRFSQSGQMEDLEESISLYRTTLDLLPIGHPDRSRSSMNLAIALKTRFEQSGRMEDLEESISLYRTTLDLLPTGHPRRSRSSMNLANAVLTRFEHGGRMEDLEESISLYRTALDLLPTGHPHRSVSSMNLATAVWTRFSQSGRMEDLEESISLYRTALNLLPIGHSDRSMSSMNLATALKTRFEQSGRMEDLEKSISLYRTALDLLPTGHPDRSMSSMNLANAVSTRFEQSGRTEDLEESISLFRTALDLLPTGHTDRSRSSMNLATAVWTRFSQSGRMEDLEESISLYRTALDLLPTGHPRRSKSSMNLAIALRTRFERVYHEGDLKEAIELLESGARHEFSSSLTCLLSAARWANLARSHSHSTTLSAYSTALLLLERSLNVVPTVNMQHELLNGKSGYPTLAVDAASYAIGMGDLAQAVEFLEQGRALLWSQMRGFRTAIDHLAEVDKELADNFKNVTKKLEALTTEASSETSFPGLNAVDGLTDKLQSGRLSLDEMMARGRRLSEDRKKIINKIREVPRFRNFMRATPFVTLQRAADEGPIVIINHSKYRTDAIIILREHDPVLVPLSEGIPEIYGTMYELYTRLTGARRDLPSVPKNYSEIVRFIMEKLWTLVVCKVADILKEIGIEEQSRIWWCPTSIFQALPLHAAGILFKDDRGRTSFRSHKYISSYTPTLNALIQARSTIRSDTARELSLLVIAQQDESLQNVGHEIDLIRNPGRSVTRLIGEQATNNKVLESLKSHAWVHFACHGELVPGRPFDSSFRLFRGDRLSLLEIVRARLPNAELAFLAACHSAEQTVDSAHDEVLHLAAGVQFCGFRSVIGTMWAMLDEDGPALTQEFYTHMSAADGTPEVGFKRSARALHKAIREMRKKKVSVERWVNFVHIGA